MCIRDSVCRKAVASFLKSVRNDLQVEMLGIDTELFISDYRYFLDMVQTLNSQKWELLISPFKSKMAELIAMNTNAVHKPVSYTHLDVYKRQHPDTVHQNNNPLIFATYFHLK